MRLVVATSPLHEAAVKALRSFCEFSLAEGNEPEQIVDAAREASVLIVRDPLASDTFDRCPKLGAVIRHGTGLDVIPVDEASRAGVIVANTPGENVESVAEYIVMMSLVLLRRLEGAANWSNHAVGDDAEVWTPGTLGGKTVGIVGAGAIAGALSNRLSGFGSKLIGYRRRSEEMPHGVGFRELSEVLQTSDVVVIALPSNSSTMSAIGSQELRQMKRGSVLVSVSRTDVIDVGALQSLLREGWLSGAALDVFGNSVNDRSLRSSGSPGLIVTSHTAGVTDEAFRRMGMACAEAARALLQGQQPPHVVNEIEVRGRTRMPLEWRSSHSSMT